VLDTTCRIPILSFRSIFSFSDFISGDANLGGAEVLVHYPCAGGRGADDHHYADEKHRELVPQRSRLAADCTPQKPEPREPCRQKLK